MHDELENYYFEFDDQGGYEQKNWLQNNYYSLSDQNDYGQGVSDHGVFLRSQQMEFDSFTFMNPV